MSDILLPSITELTVLGLHDRVRPNPAQMWRIEYDHIESSIIIWDISKVSNYIGIDMDMLSMDISMFLPDIHINDIGMVFLEPEHF